ncbi:hypothetical protein [Methylobacterium ajmalii]|uniref:hypothetical protein n=1 Tax=Methylobacterium ajmalii TaxID=2738439 RepID=UPI002F35E3C3
MSPPPARQPAYEATTWRWLGQAPGISNNPPVWPSLIWGKNWALADDGRLTIHQVDGPLVLELGDSVEIWPDQHLTRAA